MNSPVTPMMKQYFDIKREYEDCILFFRLGDFYEMFYEDAQIASEILEITLTGKDCGQEQRAPMCGVPYHSAQNYIAKLIKNGKKVAICEQVEDPKTAKGIVKRDVIRIITPGTANLDAVLQNDENNYLACIYLDDEVYGVSFCDVSTGELVTTQGKNDIVENRLLNILACFKPSEIIMNDKSSKFANVFSELKNRFEFCDSYLPEQEFDLEISKHRIYSKFEHIRPGGFLADKEACIRSLGALVDYLSQTQKTDLSHISEVKYYDACDYMEIDISSRRNLELTQTMRDKSKKGSLYGILDKTKTGMGARLLKSWIDRPLISSSMINQRLDAVEELSHKIEIREELTTSFKQINDIERILSKVVYGTCNARDFLSLKQSMSVFGDVKRAINACDCAMFKELAANFDTMADTYRLLDSAFVDDAPLTVREGGMIKSGFDKELDKLKSIMQNSTAVLAQMEAEEREKTDIKNLKITYNKVFGYYIEVTKSQLDKVPDSYIRKQTLTNCERFITQELKTLENDILSAKSRVNDLEYEDFCYVRSELEKNTEKLQKIAHIIATADVLCSFATVASAYNYTRPTVNDGDVIDIKGGRHPIVELSLNGTFFVPNDTYLDTNENKFSIITGPNMAGKSTYMRQTALIVLMAQIGSFVPASACSVGIVDKIFTRIGASDDLASGQSTFMVEMNEVANILKNATSKSLLVLDEIGRGTSTFDGLSIAWAVVEYVCKNIGAKSLFATHYHELIDLENKIEGIKNYSVAVKRRGEDITFLRKIVKGGTDDSFGIEVAKLAGVPDEVITRAKDVLKAVETGQPASNGEEISLKIDHNKKAEKENNKIFKIIANIDISTLTPLEAMNELYQLQKKVSELDEN